MAKKAYIGAESTAHRVRRMYIGVEQEVFSGDSGSSSNNLFQYDIASGNAINFSVTTNKTVYDSGLGRNEMVFPASGDNGVTDDIIRFPNWGYIGSKSATEFHNGYMSLSTTGNYLWSYKTDDTYYTCWYMGYGLSTLLWRQGLSTTPSAQYLANGSYVLSVVLDDNSINSFSFTVSMGTIADTSQTFDWGTIGMTARATYEYQSRTPQCYLYIMPKVGTTIKIKHIELVAGTNSNISVSTTDVARRTKKAYIGIGGVARPCFGGGQLARYGTITPLSVARRASGVANVGKYMLVMGGDNATAATTGFYDIVDAYDTSLTRSTAPSLRCSSSDGAAGSVGGYAFYAGGGNSGYESSMTNIQRVTAYDKDLVISSPPDLSQKRYRTSGIASPTHFIVGPGEFGGSARANVEAYDKNLAKTVATSVSVTRAYVSTATIGKYAIFAGGGYNGTNYKNVDVYDENLTRTTGTALNNAKWAVSSAYCEKFVAFVGGGGSGTTRFSDAEVFDSELVKTTIPSLTTAGFNHFGAGLEGEIVFAGGEGVNGTKFSAVECYNENFTKKTLDSLSEAKVKGGSCSPKNSGVIGDYIVFAGGHASAPVSTAEAYTLV